MPKYTIPLKSQEIPQNKENVNRMGWRGKDNEVENTEKLATDLQHVVIGATAYSALLVSCVAVSF